MLFLLTPDACRLPPTPAQIGEGEGGGEGGGDGERIERRGAGEHRAECEAAPNERDLFGPTADA